MAPSNQGPINRQNSMSLRQMRERQARAAREGDDENLSLRRNKMLKDVGLSVICDFIAAVVIAIFLFPKTTVASECTPILFWIGCGFFLYQCFFVVRNLLVILCTYWSRKPDDRALLIRLTWSLLDWTLLFGLVLWATIEF